MNEYIVRTNNREETALVAVQLLKENGFDLRMQDVWEWNYVVKSDKMKADINAHFLNDKIPEAVKHLPEISFEEWEKINKKIYLTVV